jgi:hypothetical protein
MTSKVPAKNSRSSAGIKVSSSEKHAYFIAPDMTERRTYMPASEWYRPGGAWGVEG